MMNHYPPVDVHQLFLFDPSSAYAHMMTWKPSQTELSS